MCSAGGEDDGADSNLCNNDNNNNNRFNVNLGAICTPLPNERATAAPHIHRLTACRPWKKSPRFRSNQFYAKAENKRKSEAFVPIHISHTRAAINVIEKNKEKNNSNRFRGHHLRRTNMKVEKKKRRKIYPQHGARAHEFSVAAHTYCNISSVQNKNQTTTEECVYSDSGMSETAVLLP